jgi:hypothetical protein
VFKIKGWNKGTNNKVTEKFKKKMLRHGGRETLLPVEAEE